MNVSIDQRAINILISLKSDHQLSRFVNERLKIPHVYQGSDKIRLIILGQDPTVKNTASRAMIETVLNLDKHGSLRYYLSHICNSLNLHLENVYATNYLKNFFITPPTQIKEINIFKEFSPFWLPLLKEELAQFPNVPIISLGQPLLQAIIINDASPRVRDYWGYTADWKSSGRCPFLRLEPNKTVFGRAAYPFPHQPSIKKVFYTNRLSDYCIYLREHME